MIDGLNRFLLTLLSALFIAAGVIGIGAATDLFNLQEFPSLYADAKSTASDPVVFWIIVAVLILLAILALLWALRQLFVARPGGALSTVTLDKTEHGETNVEATAIAGAAAADLRRLPGVKDASARLVDDGTGWLLRGKLDIPAGGDLRTVRAEAREVYARVADALGSQGLKTHTELRPIGDPPRVR